MLFSIIIPTCNRNEMLGPCLERLVPGKQTIPVHQYEVIVTDDGEAGSAESFCKEFFPFVCYTKGPEKGPAANRNNGARLAKGNWMVFTDDDCLPDAGWLQAYAEAIEQYPGCKAFEGAILPDSWDLLKMDMAECPVNKEGGCFWSANIMVERETFWKVSGFDECFKIAAQEDQDIKLRLAQFTKIIFVPSSVVIHPVRIVTLKNRIAKIEAQSFNWVLFIKKHFNQERRIKLINNSLNVHAKGFTYNFFCGRFSKATYHLAALKFIIGNRNKLIKASRDNYIKHN